MNFENTFYKGTRDFSFTDEKMESYFDSNGIYTQAKSAVVSQSVFDMWTSHFNVYHKNRNGWISYIQDCIKNTHLYQKRQNGQDLSVNDFLNDIRLMNDKETFLVVSTSKFGNIYRAFLSNHNCNYLPIFVKIQNFYNTPENNMLVHLECSKNWSIPSKWNLFSHIIDTFVVYHKDLITQKSISTVYTLMEYAADSLSVLFSENQSVVVIFEIYVELLMAIIDMSQVNQTHEEMYLDHIMYLDIPSVNKFFIIRHDTYQYTQYVLPSLSIQIKIPEIGVCEKEWNLQNKTILFTHMDQLQTIHVKDFANLQKYGKDILSITHQFYQYANAIPGQNHSLLSFYFSKILSYYLSIFKQNPMYFQSNQELLGFIHNILSESFMDRDLYTLVGISITNHTA